MLKSVYKRRVKRILDFTASFLALILLSPLLLMVAVMVRIMLGSPVVFKQQRAGFHEKAFYVYKFRSMTNAKDKNGELLPEYMRISKFGQFLRSISLDELPQLYNILKGDMSFIGPRPLYIKYIPFYDENEKRRHEVLPGLTGLAQVNGRNALKWEDKLAYDIQYIDSISFKNDILIFFKTIKRVLSRHDVGIPGGVEDFDSYRKRQL